MRAAIIHLIEKHNCKKMAFIPGAAGNTVSEYRLMAYKDVLEEYNIPYDPDLVAPCDFWFEDSGYRAVETLINKRNK
jgi:DNA-binding LacI/PurR family transcriptional regulator